MLSLTLTIILAVIAIIIVYFARKKIGHEIKHVFFSVIICIMLTSMIQLGIFYFIMKFKVFTMLCKYGFDCNALFNGFLTMSIYSSIAIFAIILSVYYIFKILKGIFKIAIVVIGIALIVVAGVVIYNNYFSNNPILPDTDACIIDEDCIIIQDNGNASAMNGRYIEGRLEDLPNYINETLSCMYRGICVDSKCGIELKENVSACFNFTV
jgi:hypothetical protein